MTAKTQINIFIVSDGTGATAESVLTSVMVQFVGAKVNITRFPFTRTEEEINQIVKKAPKGKCIIIFTLVSETLRNLLIDKSQKKQLEAVDVMGPLIHTFSHILDYAPTMKPGVFTRQDDEMYLLAEAIHYTLSHDDGLGLETLDQANLIILGVSRSGKTPLSIYLSCRKLKVANIPIIHNVPLPKEIMKAPGKKIGLNIDLPRLSQLREERMRRMGRARIPNYTSKSSLIKELEYCAQVYRKIPQLHTINISGRAIEETAEWITHNVL